MAVGAGAVRPARPRAVLADAEAIDWLARLLLVAVATDLILTRVVVRLAIFVPKGEPFSTLGAALGRLGAVADAFVPLAGLLLLGALLLRAGRTGRRGEALILFALAVVSAGGFALTYLPPRPEVLLVLESLVVAVAVGSVIHVRDTRGPVLARIGLVALAAAMALAAIGHAVDLAGVVAGSSGVSAMTFNVLGQLSFVCGVALVGLSGALDLVRHGPSRGRFIAVGAAAALLVGLTAARAPATSGAIMIWSTGLAGAVPDPIVAVALGLAVTGLPVLYRRAPALAIGASIILCSGYGLAASGLVLAGLLGLVVACWTGRSDPDPVGDRNRAP